ncbi:MAG: MFS transporter, partial [Deltaproteobacteria bacterium]|nr:MFS transporter [Nannocystaceae bacterium]
LESALTRAGTPSAGGVRLGGSVLAGLRDVVRTPTLRTIAIYVLLYTATSTVLYVVQGSIVRDAFPERDARTAYFASLDLAVSLLALTLQLGLTRVLLVRLPVAAVLMILPVATIGVLATLGARPTLAVLTAVQVARRALEHAIAKPGRELLYDRADREVKLKGQNAVDTAVYRAGDMVSGWLVAGLGALGMVGGGLLLAFVPIAVVWTWFAGRIAPREG